MAPRTIEKMKILGAILELCNSTVPIQPVYLRIGLNWPNRQCFLACSSQRAPRILIFSIVLGAENLSYVKSIETHARAFLPLNISAISSVQWTKNNQHSPENFCSVTNLAYLSLWNPKMRMNLTASLNTFFWEQIVISSKHWTSTLNNPEKSSISA